MVTSQGTEEYRISVRLWHFQERGCFWLMSKQEQKEERRTGKSFVSVRRWSCLHRRFISPAVQDDVLTSLHGLKMRGNLVELKGTTDIKLLHYFYIQK